MVFESATIYVCAPITIDKHLMSVRSYNNDKIFKEQQQQDTSELYEVAKNRLSPKKKHSQLGPDHVRHCPLRAEVQLQARQATHW